MVGNTNIHWTGDEELLSKYVLRQLPPAEDAHLTEHLTTCEQCQKAVNQEGLIAAGTKLAAREEIKHRLESRLAIDDQRAATSASRGKRREVPWVRIAGLAAAAIVIVVVGVHNNWFGTGYPHTPSIPENVVQEQSQPEVESAQKSLEADQRVSETVQESRRSKDLAQSTNDDEKELLEKDKVGKADFRERSENKKERPVEESQLPIAAAPVAGADARMDAVEGMKSETETRLTDKAMIPPPQAFWVEGYIVASSPTLDEHSKERPSPSNETLNNLYIWRGSAEKKRLQDSRTSETSATLTNISLTQRPSSTLPPALQHRRGRPGRVQTFIENRADSIQLTLYLDSLVSKSSLRSESIETIGSDSLLLHLPNQRIGLRLPSVLLEQVKSKVIR